MSDTTVENPNAAYPPYPPMTNQTFTRPAPESSPTNSHGIQINKEYLFSRIGIIRILLIVFQFAGWVSAASATSRCYIYTDGYPTRSAYLFFSIVGFLFLLFLLGLFGFNLKNNVTVLNQLPWDPIIFIIDAIWAFVTLILAIVSAVQESKISGCPLDKGGLGAASFFAFVCTFLYIADAVLIWPAIQSFIGRNNASNSNDAPVNI